MAGAKVVVLYPAPRDAAAFERAYSQDHTPMVTAQNFKGLEKFVASKVLGTPDGAPRLLLESQNFTFRRWKSSRQPRHLLRLRRSSHMPFRSRAAVNRSFWLLKKKPRSSRHLRGSCPVIPGRCGHSRLVQHPNRYDGRARSRWVSGRCTSG